MPSTWVLAFRSPNSSLPTRGGELKPGLVTVTNEPIGSYEQAVRTCADFILKNKLTDDGLFTKETVSTWNLCCDFLNDLLLKKIEQAKVLHAQFGKDAQIRGENEQTPAEEVPKT